MHWQRTGWSMQHRLRYVAPCSVAPARASLGPRTLITYRHNWWSRGMALARGTCVVRSRAILGHLQTTSARAVANTVASSAGAAPIKPLPDPHNVSHSLDAETSARIVDRLESRGQDEIFRSLFLGYFPDLYNCQNVLEIGCGTVRASMEQRPLFVSTCAISCSTVHTWRVQSDVYADLLHARCV